MPSSVDSTLEELASRLRALKREAGHVFMLDALRRQFLGAAGEEAASAASPSATAASTRALPQRFPKTSLGKDSTHRPMRHVPSGACETRCDETAIDATATNSRKERSLTQIIVNTPGDTTGGFSLLMPSFWPPLNLTLRFDHVKRTATIAATLLA